MNAEFTALFFVTRILSGLLCGGLLYAGVALIRAKNEDGSRTPWSLTGLALIPVVVLVYVYDLGIFFQLAFLFRYWAKLDSFVIWIGEVAPLVLSALCIIIGYAWGRQVYKNQYQALEERGFVRAGRPAAFT